MPAYGHLFFVSGVFANFFRFTRSHHEDAAVEGRLLRDYLT